eukprot:jgi/Bigna1/77867/fgenesh1_pg.51_\
MDGERLDIDPEIQPGRESCEWRQSCRYALTMSCSPVRFPSSVDWIIAGYLCDMDELEFTERSNGLDIEEDPDLNFDLFQAACKRHLFSMGRDRRFTARSLGALYESAHQFLNQIAMAHFVGTTEDVEGVTPGDPGESLFPRAHQKIIRDAPLKCLPTASHVSVKEAKKMVGAMDAEIMSRPDAKSISKYYSRGWHNSEESSPELWTQTYLEMNAFNTNTPFEDFKGCMTLVEKGRRGHERCLEKNAAKKPKQLTYDAAFINESISRGRRLIRGCMVLRKLPAFIEPSPSGTEEEEEEEEESRILHKRKRRRYVPPPHHEECCKRIVANLDFDPAFISWRIRCLFDDSPDLSAIKLEQNTAGNSKNEYDASKYNPSAYLAGVLSHLAFEVLLA